MFHSHTKDIECDYPEKVKTVSEKLQDELEPIKNFLEKTEERKSKEWIEGYNKWKKSQKST